MCSQTESLIIATFMRRTSAAARHARPRRGESLMLVQPSYR
jgi:hypothetical protein